MIIIDATLGYHNQNPYRKSSYLTTFACKFGRYRFTRLPFGMVLSGNILQRKIEEIFRGYSNVFGIADAILLVGYDADGRDHDIES